MIRIIHDRDGAWERTVLPPDRFAREVACWSRSMHDCLLRVVRTYDGRFRWEVAPILDATVPTMTGYSTIAVGARIEAMQAARGWHLEQQERAHEAAALLATCCCFCQTQTPDTDRLKYGKAVAHAACVFAASKRLRTAKVAVLLKRSIKQRAATGG